MYDLDHTFGGDLNISDTGDLALVHDDQWGLQRILRRLLTNPAATDVSGNVVATGDYLWQQDYGAGAGKKVGEIADVAEITALIRGQMLLEDAVAQVPEPEVTVTHVENGINVDVQYNDATTGKQKYLSFDVNI